MSQQKERTGKSTLRKHTLLLILYHITVSNASIFSKVKVDLQFYCKGHSDLKIYEMRYLNMKIKVCGKAHLEGVAKKTGRPYNFNQIHYLGKARGVIGEAALTLALDPEIYPIDLIEVGKEYNVDFDNRGYVVDFSPAK